MGCITSKHQQRLHQLEAHAESLKVQLSQVQDQHQVQLNQMRHDHLAEQYKCHVLEELAATAELDAEQSRVDLGQTKLRVDVLKWELMRLKRTLARDTTTRLLVSSFRTTLQPQEKKTQEQLKADILLDPDYINMKKTLVDYDVKYHQAKTSYQNKMTEISLLQSELKRELSFVAKESK